MLSIESTVILIEYLFMIPVSTHAKKMMKARIGNLHWKNLTLLHPEGNYHR